MVAPGAVGALDMILLNVAGTLCNSPTYVTVIVPATTSPSPSNSVADRNAKKSKTAETERPITIARPIRFWARSRSSPFAKAAYTKRLTRGTSPNPITARARYLTDAG